MIREGVTTPKRRGPRSGCQAALVRLQAEMKVPGRAWLEFEVTDQGASSTIRQTAIFDPVGLFGRTYRYALYPLHKFIFAGMLRNIARGRRTDTLRLTFPLLKRDHALMT